MVRAGAGVSPRAAAELLPTRQVAVQHEEGDGDGRQEQPGPGREHPRPARLDGQRTRDLAARARGLGPRLVALARVASARSGSLPPAAKVSSSETRASRTGTSELRSWTITLTSARPTESGVGVVKTVSTKGPAGRLTRTSPPSAAASVGSSATSADGSSSRPLPGRGMPTP
jgi:hypothetical protein